MIFEELILKGSYCITLDIKEDDRGWFARTYCKREFLNIGHTKEWVQMNHSFSLNIGTLRGMHFQFSPNTEIKLVRCISGKIFDVIVDLRKKSPTFLQWVGVELSEQNKKALYIPEGFAHGFQSLSQNTQIIYQHTEFYNPSTESGFRYNDPLIGINWPISVSEISERDTKHDFIKLNFKGI
jgi:dTDP-4-dehydrorhamnose 3,5-epimerase